MSNANNNAVYKWWVNLSQGRSLYCLLWQLFETFIFVVWCLVFFFVVVLF